MPLAVCYASGHLVTLGPGVSQWERPNIGLESLQDHSQGCPCGQVTSTERLHADPSGHGILSVKDANRWFNNQKPEKIDKNRQKKKKDIEKVEYIKLEVDIKNPAIKKLST